MPSVSFEFSARQSRAKAVRDLFGAESFVEDGEEEEEEEKCVGKEEVAMEEEDVIEREVPAADEAVMGEETVDVEVLSEPDSVSVSSAFFLSI